MLKNLGVKFHVDRELLSIDNDQVVMRDLYTGKKSSFKNISAVVMVQGGAANDQLYHSLCDSKPCHLIGDAMAQRRVNDAINEGELVARQI